MQERSGLAHALNDGDDVIMSTGATAKVRGNYPAGYSGSVDILLDGTSQSETSDALTLTEPPKNALELGDESVARSDELFDKADASDVDAPSRRMQD